MTITEFYLDKCKKEEVEPTEYIMSALEYIEKNPDKVIFIHKRYGRSYLRGLYLEYLFTVKILK